MGQAFHWASLALAFAPELCALGASGVDNGRVRWLGVDLPETVKVRRRLLPDSPRQRTLACSALSIVPRICCHTYTHTTSTLEAMKRADRNEARRLRYRTATIVKVGAFVDGLQNSHREFRTSLIWGMRLVARLARVATLVKRGGLGGPAFREEEICTR